MASRLLTQTVVGTSFSFYTDDEVRRLSIKAITNPQVRGSHLLHLHPPPPASLPAGGKGAAFAPQPSSTPAASAV
jgi:hypothetical protein